MKISTYTGRLFDPRYAIPADIDLIDIAAALSKICRWGGHCRMHYSVAQHSCYVANILPADLRIYGLLHDAHEAYIGDLVTPVKHLFDTAGAGYRQLTHHLDRTILFALDLPGLSTIEQTAIAHADRRLLATEMDQLMHHTDTSLADVERAPVQIREWPNRYAYDRWLYFVRAELSTRL